MTGLRELLHAADQADKATKKLVRSELREAARPVLEDATTRMEEISPRFKFGISVRKAGTVSVEERLRKTTGRRPDYGGVQMRDALLPALEAKEGQVNDILSEAVDRLARRFEL